MSVDGVAALLPVELVGPIHEVVVAVEDVLEALGDDRGGLLRNEVLDDQEPIVPVLLYLFLAELADHPRPP